MAMASDSSFASKLRAMADLDAAGLSALSPADRRTLSEDTTPRRKPERRPGCVPNGWPTDIDYLTSNDLSSLSAREKKMVRPGASGRIPGIEICEIVDEGHPARGQNGLYATRMFTNGEVLGEYTGYVMPGHMGSEYTTRLWDGDDAPNAGYNMPACDASRGGNEMRMINDFRGVPGATGPNVRFSRCQIQGARAALIVAVRAIERGEELLLDYGERYWSAQPASPGGQEAPPSEAEVAAVEWELCEMLGQALEDAGGPSAASEVMNG